MPSNTYSTICARNPDMKPTLETTFTPADFEALTTRDLRAAVCVVFDVLRATSSMLAALQAGATAIVPAAEIAEALELYRQRPEVLLAGERQGLRIRASQTGGVDFHLGNSPREFVPERVRGRTIVMTTTNGTRALRACAGAGAVLIASFLNLAATAGWLRQRAPEQLILVCGGTFEQTALEDVLAAGALADAVWDLFATGQVSDAALMARQLFNQGRHDLAGAVAQARNARRLLANPELCADVPFCIALNEIPLVAGLHQRDCIMPWPA